MKLTDNILSLAYAVEREACKNSLFEFVQSFWSVIIKEEPVYNWHIPYLCDELQKLSVPIVARSKKPYDIIINIPPGTTKSTICTIIFPAWLWTQDARLRIITNSYSGDLSVEHASKSKDIIQSEKFKRLFPEVTIRKDKSGKGAYENTSTGARYSTSTGGTITGKHAHVIINDDPVNPNQAVSNVMREVANQHTKTLSSRKVNKENTPIITIMQRLHEKDVTGYLLGRKADAIKHICIPADLSYPVFPVELKEHYVGGLLDPIRINRGVIDEAMIDLGGNGYAGQYGQSPVTEGGNIIKEDWFGKIAYNDYMPLRRSEPIVFFLDTAYTENTKNDPTGIMGTIKIGNTLYITVAKKVYKNFPELIKFVPPFVKENGYTQSSSVRIEPKANGISVVDQLKVSTGLNVVKTNAPTESKETKLNAASPTIEAGRVVLVMGAWNEEFISEICGFPNKEHDEYVDLICYAIDFHKMGKLKKQNLTGLF